MGCISSLTIKKSDNIVYFIYTSSTTNIGSTPLIAEKPFIVFEEGKYFLAKPKLKSYSVGISNY
jgi:hypothetical protein